MFDRCLDFFLREPRRLVRAGSGLLSLGGVLIVLGLRVVIATTALSAVTRARGGTAIEAADIWPGLPAWWIPETLFRFGFALVLSFLGVWAIWIGRMYQRLR